MSLLNVPTPENFYKKANGLYFEALISLLNNMLFKNEHDFSVNITPVESNNIINMFHQSCELYLKGKVTETSPFLLINNLKSRDFLDCFTLDANVLQDVLSKTNPNFINKEMSTVFEKYRVFRNKDTHSFSSVDISDSQYTEYFFDFIDVFNLFNINETFTFELKKFLDLKYQKKMLNIRKNKNITSDKYRAIYINLIMSLFTNISLEKENEVNIGREKKQNEKILKLLKIPYDNIFEFPKNMLYCNRCTEEFHCDFNQITLENIIKYKNENKHTVYLLNSYYHCLCCEKDYKINDIINNICNICISINLIDNVSEHHDSVCMCCNIILSDNELYYLKYGCRVSNERPPNTNFYQNFQKDNTVTDNVNNFLNLMSGIRDVYMLNDYTHIRSPLELIAASCTEYSLFYEMLVNEKKIEDCFFISEKEKIIIYNEHKNRFTIEETMLFVLEKYKYYLEDYLLKSTILKNSYQINKILNMFHDGCWNYIFDTIHDYYGLKVNEENYNELLLEYFELDPLKEEQTFLKIHEILLFKNLK